MKAASFIWGIVAFVLSVLMSALCYGVYTSIEQTSGGAGAFSLIVTIPLMIILYLILLGFMTASVVSLFKAAFSENKAIKIISIIFIVLEVAVLVFDIFIALKVL